MIQWKDHQLCSPKTWFPVLSPVCSAPPGHWCELAPSWPLHPPLELLGTQWDNASRTLVLGNGQEYYSLLLLIMNM